MACTNERVPDWLLERLAAGELPAAQARACGNAWLQPAITIGLLRWPRRTPRS